MQREVLRKQIEQLNERLIGLRQDAQDDFDRLAAHEQQGRSAVFVEAEPAQFDNMTLGSEIDMFRIAISGYASQVAGWARIVEDAERAQARLREYRIFDSLYLSEWYLKDAVAYPGLRHYIETVDYLRLLLIQYLDMPQPD